MVSKANSRQIFTHVVRNDTHNQIMQAIRFEIVLEIQYMAFLAVS
jgi:hypothetical protein